MEEGVFGDVVEFVAVEGTVFVDDGCAVAFVAVKKARKNRVVSLV